jgi:hypothetical protein
LAAGAQKVHHAIHDGLHVPGIRGGALGRQQHRDFSLLSPRKHRSEPQSSIRGPKRSEKAELAELSNDEIAISNSYHRKGLAYLKDHPEKFILNGRAKIMAAFGLLPSPRGSTWRNIAYFVTYAPIMALGLWGMWLDRQRWRMSMPIYWLFVSFAAITGVLWGHTSHRAYLDVYWIIYASAVLIGLLASIVKRKSSDMAVQSNE